jgi:hypothetical protein
MHYAFYYSSRDNSRGARPVYCVTLQQKLRGLCPEVMLTCENPTCSTDLIWRAACHMHLHCFKTTAGFSQVRTCGTCNALGVLGKRATKGIAYNIVIKCSNLLGNSMIDSRSPTNLFSPIHEEKNLARSSSINPITPSERLHGKACEELLLLNCGGRTFILYFVYSSV